MSRKTKNDTHGLNASNLLNIKKIGPEGWSAKEDDLIGFLRFMALTVALIGARQKSRRSNHPTAIRFPA